MSKLLREYISTLLEVDKRSVIINKIGLPKFIADWAHELDNKRSLWIVNTFLDEFSEKYGTGPLTGLKTKEEVSEPIAGLAKEMMAELDPKYKAIVKWMKQEGSKGSLPNIEQKKLDDVYEMTFESENDPAGEVVLKYGNGYYWINLGDSDCPEEAEAMGHCGRAYDRKASLYSLRDKNRKSHITIEFNADSGVVRQIKGKANSKPKKEYHEYIVDFLIKMPVESLELNDNIDLQVSDLSEELQEKLKEEKPDLKAAGTLFGLIRDNEDGQIDIREEDWDVSGGSLEYEFTNYSIIGYADSLKELLEALNVERWAKHNDSTKGMVDVDFDDIDPPNLLENLNNPDSSLDIELDTENFSKLRTLMKDMFPELIARMERKYDDEQLPFQLIDLCKKSEDFSEIWTAFTTSAKEASERIEEFIGNVCGVSKSENGRWGVHLDGYTLYTIINGYSRDYSDQELPANLENVLSGGYDSYLTDQHYNNDGLEYILSDNSKELAKFWKSRISNYYNLADLVFNDSLKENLEEVSTENKSGQMKFDF